MNIAVIGKGGHSKVILDLIRETPGAVIRAILDDKVQDLHREDGILTGPIASVQALIQEIPDLRFVIAIGDNRTRRAMVRRLGLEEERYVSLISPRAWISPSCEVGCGTVVMPHAVINAEARVGKHAIINSGAVVEHDCVLEDFVHIAPQAAVTGSVLAKKGAFIGAGASVIPGVRIGEWTVVGAGATVIYDLPGYCTSVGTPARIISIYEFGDEMDDDRKEA